MTKKIYISAGELSGDKYGALLSTKLKELNHSLNITGMGGLHMRKAGVTILEDISSMSTIGFIEAIKYIPKLFITLKKIKHILMTEKPDHIIVIDCQGFHMHVLKIAKKLGISSTYFIAPQEWQWGTEEGGKKVAQQCSQILTIFEQEQNFYKKLSFKTQFVGHPSLDLVKATSSQRDFYKTYNITPDQKILALFPGSRTQEIKRMTPLLIKAAKQCQTHTPNLTIIISVSHKRYLSHISHIIKKENIKQIIIYQDNPHNLIKYATLSLTTSGTVTLEHALLETPCIVAYKFHPITYIIGMLFFPKLRSQLMSLPNIYLNSKIVPEFLQHHATPSNLSSSAIALLKNKEKYDTLLKKLSPIRKMMGKPGAIDRAATKINALLDSKNS